MRIKEKLMAFFREEEGLTTVEYAIGGSLVGLAIIAAFTDLGTGVARVINAIVTDIGGP